MAPRCESGEASWALMYSLSDIAKLKDIVKGAQVLVRGLHPSTQCVQHGTPAMICLIYVQTQAAKMLQYANIQWECFEAAIIQSVSPHNLREWDQAQGLSYSVCRLIW